MTFRDATIEDLPTIVEIYNSTIESRMVTADTTPVSVDSKIDWFHEHNPQHRPLWMIENSDKQTIGWCSFQDFYGRPAYSGTAEISIYLNENFRNKGFGKLILQHAISSCKELEIHTLTGFIFAHNTKSIKLFESLGFTEWGHLHEIAIMDGKHFSLKIMGLKITQNQ
jgi:phosphinothricin acetyltransferase